MKAAPIPADEAARLEALRTTKLLDSPPERDFDDFTDLAALVCGVPIALISLVDEKRQWFKSRVGLEVAETPRDVSFCGHSIMRPVLFEVPDTHLDARFADNPLVLGQPKVRFYAGAPLVTAGGHALGTLCVIDHEPRSLSAAQREGLMALGRQIMVQIELRARIAERDGIQRRLRDSTELADMSSAALQDFLANASDLVQSVNPEGQLTYVNQAWTTTFGYGAHEVLGLSLWELMAPGEAVKCRHLFERVMAGESLAHIETTFVTKTGALVELEGSATAWKVGGKVLAARSIFRNVTERRRIEAERLQAVQALQATHALKDAILSSADVSIISTDLDGTIRTFNAAAERWLGYRAEEVVGRTTPALIHDEGEVIARAAELTLELGRPVAPGFEAFVAKARLGPADTREWTYVGKHGTRIPVWLSVTLMTDPDGKPRGFLGVAADIRERKQLERIKNEFISTVSHELRTPLTSIRGALGLLAGGVLGALPEPAMELVEIARANSERLIRLINDILDLEKIEAGRMTMVMRQLDARHLGSLTLAAIAPLAGSSGVELRSDIPAGLVLVGDEDRLVQVLTNLVSNAIKFSRRGGQVTLAVQETSDTVEFSVTDQGVGIAPDDLGKLFEKFQQLDSSDSRRNGGTGLGLAISKAIINQHRGRVGVDSSLGVGTRFWFELPRQELAPSGAVRPAGTGPPGQRKPGPPRVLVVEDDASTREVLSRQLATLGLACISARDGAQAIELAHSEEPDLIILDLALPVADGFQVVEVLRRERCSSTPLIVFSGLDLAALDRKALTLGVTRHLQKTRASEAEFLVAVKELLAGLWQPSPR